MSTPGVDRVSAADRPPADVPDFDHARAEAAVRELLIAIGEDPEREGLHETPARVARAYAELTAGLRMSPEDVLTTTFDIGHDEMVLVRDIELWSMCEHHLVPFTGVAHVGYIPSESGKITGLSKLARLVDVYAKRPQVQERLTTQVADALMRHPRGARRDRGDRGRAPVHDHARRPQGRSPHDHVRGARPDAQRRHQVRGDGAHQRQTQRSLMLPPGILTGLTRTDRPVLMGVVNVTPDSFSDGGRWATPDAAIAHGRTLLVAGADILDVGGESTRPGATRPLVEDELARVVPVITALAADGAVVSVDTMRSEVALAALESGARIVNDVSGGLADPRMLSTVAAAGAAYVAMHWRAHSETMQQHASYDGPGGVVAAVRDELAERVEAMLACGHRARPDRARPRHRLRQDRRAQLDPAARARPDRRAGLPGAGGRLAEGVPGQSAGRARRGRPRGRGARARQLGPARPARPGGCLGPAHPRRARRPRRPASPRPLEPDPCDHGGAQ